MDTTDAELVRACQRGDDAAWEMLVQRYKRLMYAIPRRAGLDQEAAADVFQRVFLTLLEHLDGLHDPSRVRAWLVTAARRETWRLARQHATTRAAGSGASDDQELLEMPDGAPLPGETLLLLEQQHLVRTAVGRLDTRCQELVELLFYRPEPPQYEEVARILGIAEGSIGPIRARCLQRLKKFLQDSSAA
jgi:RNA polymerase sigma factor (sigma-70 family)